VVVAVQEALDSRKTKKHSRGPCGFRKKDYFYNWGEVITVLEALDSKTKYFKALTSENPFKLWTSAVIASKRTNSKLLQNSRTTTYIKGNEFSLSLLIINKTLCTITLTIEGESSLAGYCKWLSYSCKCGLRNRQHIGSNY
jgi:hypothetical protein